jgi:hypothetical protein
MPVWRITAVFSAFVAFTATFVILPVYAAPGPEAEPVKTSVDEVALGSVAAPAPEADLQHGTTEPVTGVQSTAPVLTVRETDVDEFSLVGVSWANDPAVTDTLVQVRVQDASGDWGEWTEIGTETTQPNSEADAAPKLRGGTEPLWTGPSNGVEAELVTRSGAQPTDVTLDLIDPGESDADTAVLGSPDITDSAHAASAMPAVYSRAQWGADESLMTWAPQYSSTVKAAVLHHTAGSNDYSAAQVPAILRGIYRYHAVTRGWGDIGYNVLADKYGRLWEGRRGGLSRPTIGAHTLGFNSYTFGVSMIGNYDTAPTTGPLIAAAVSFMSWKLSLYHVNPLATTTLVSGGTDKWAAGRSVTFPTILAHSDTKSTECPGRYGYAKLPEIRSRVASLTYQSSFIKALYEDMLGRAADEAGLRSWTDAIARGWSKRSVVRGFANSSEYRKLRITQAYQQVLGRNPDPIGMNSWLTALARGTARLDLIGPTLMKSREFYERGGSSDAAFVDNIYQAALGRHAAPSEVDYWAPIRRLFGAGVVMADVWFSQEARLRRIGQAYDYWLDRAASAAERLHWYPLVARYGDEQLREELVVSSEYAGKAAARFP